MNDERALKGWDKRKTKKKKLFFFFFLSWKNKVRISDITRWKLGLNLCKRGRKIKGCEK